MSFFLAHSWSAFVLAKGDRHGANKNEITIFVFSVTAKDFSHVRAPGWKRGDPLRVRSLTSALVAVNSVFRIGADRQRLKHVPRSGLTALPYRVQCDEGALCHRGQCATLRGCRAPFGICYRPARELGIPPRFPHIVGASVHQHGRLAEIGTIFNLLH